MKKFMLLFFVVMIISSCGYKEGVVQKSDKSFLKFTGNLKNASVQIDDTEPFLMANKNNKLYQLSPGKHIVKVYRNNHLVVKRILIFDNSVIKEVQIP
jgi:hypothetical protein